MDGVHKSSSFSERGWIEAINCQTLQQTIGNSEGLRYNGVTDRFARSMLLCELAILCAFFSLVLVTNHSENI